VKKKIVHIIILSCKTATRLIEKKLHTKLSIRENVQLKWHKSVCDACTIYEKQVVFLDEVLKHDPSQTPSGQDFPDQEVVSLQKKILGSINR